MVSHSAGVNRRLALELLELLLLTVRNRHPISPLLTVDRGKLLKLLSVHRRHCVRLSIRIASIGRHPHLLSIKLVLKKVLRSARSRVGVLARAEKARLKYLSVKQEGCRMPTMGKAPGRQASYAEAQWNSQTPVRRTVISEEGKKDVSNMFLWVQGYVGGLHSIIPILGCSGISVGIQDAIRCCLPSCVLQRVGVVGVSVSGRVLIERK